MNLNAIAAYLLTAAQRSLQSRVLPAAAATVLALGANHASPAAEAAGVPPMGGGYTDVIAIPVNDPAVKEIAGALFKPQGTGPFPLVVYMPPCGGPNFPLEFQQEKFWIERLTAKNVAVLIVDPLMPRGLDKGICDKLLTVVKDVQDKNESVLQLIQQGGDDAVAAVKLAKTLPGIDPTKIFLMGFSSGGTSSLRAADPKAGGDYDTDIAGVVTYYPLCYDGVDAAVPTLVLIGEKDDWVDVAACRAAKGNFDVAIFPGATHAFTMQFEKPFEWAGHQLAYDAKSTEEAAQRVEAFIDSRLK